jgi:LacI family transcriptional regulator
MSENREGAAKAVRHLHDLGHERIATIAGPARTSPGAARLVGYREEMQRLGLEVRNEWVAEGDFYDETGYRATRQLLELAEPPTAVFAASDLMAAGALRAASELGVRVPDQLAVVGFDDIDVAGLIQPSLTTVRQEMHDIGEAAAEGLSQMIDDPDSEPVRRIVPTRLIVRSSCGAKRAPRERTLATDKEVR